MQPPHCCFWFSSFRNYFSSFTFPDSLMFIWVSVKRLNFSPRTLLPNGRAPLPSAGFVKIWTGGKKPSLHCLMIHVNCLSPETAHWGKIWSWVVGGWEHNHLMIGNKDHRQSTGLMTLIITISPPPILNRASIVRSALLPASTTTVNLVVLVFWMILHLLKSANKFMILLV